jgi:hypothetical protein
MMDLLGEWTLRGGAWKVAAIAMLVPLAAVRMIGHLVGLIILGFTLGSLDLFD